jgi:Fe-S-cluster containining protein
MTTKLETLKKVERAAEIYDSMTTSQREAVRPYVVEISKIQRKVSEAADKVGAGKICHECEGSCCTDGIEYGVTVTEYLYAMFYLSLRQREKVLAVIKSPNIDVYCSFIEGNGCVLPKDARPINCKAFHCFMIPGSTEIMLKYGNELRAVDARYLWMLDMMEVEL